MKNYKIQIEDNEVQFFKQLMDKLNFVQYEEIAHVNEPRVYPATNFTIHSNKNQPEKDSGHIAVGKSKSRDPYKHRKDAMSEIRDAMLKIDELRNRREKL